MAPRFITPAGPGSKRIIAPEAKKPPVSGRLVGGQKCLLRDAVRPLASLVLGAFDREAHLLGEVAGDEAPDAVVLPVRGLGDLGHRRAVLAAHEVQDDGLLAELARYCGVLLGLGGLLAGGLGILLGGGLAGLFAGLLAGGGLLGDFLAFGRALLLAGLALHGGLLRRVGRALFRNGGGFGGRGGVCVRFHLVFILSAVDPRMTIHHFGQAGSKAESSGIFAWQ